MSAYEIYLLVGALFGALAVISIASAILNEGSARATAILIAVGAVFFFLAKQSNGGVVSIHDISPSINKVISMLLG